MAERPEIAAHKYHLQMLTAIFSWRSGLLADMCIKGKVFSGEGKGVRFTKLSWVEQQITEKLGFIPYRGTLNIKLSEENIKPKELLIKAKPVELLPEKGFYSGKCYRARLADAVECAVVVPEVPDYPADVIEVIAPINLRRKLKLRDGDIVEVEISQ